MYLIKTAKQLLGDTSDEAARVYAVRQAGAITGIEQKMWNAQDESGRKWAQFESRNKKTPRYREVV